MDTENSEQVEGVVLDTGDGETLVVDLPNGEGESENAGESEAVRLAEIAAEKEVVIATIHADVETARIETDAERNATWPEEKEALQASITELTQQVALLEAQVSLSNPTPPLVEAVEEVVEEAVENAIAPDESLTPLSTPELTSETGTELGPDAGEENAEAVAAVVLAVPARARRRLI
jgi:hypothetical protein